jgi:AIPR protein
MELLNSVSVFLGEDQSTVDKVISATNRQTPVTSSILRATDEIQRKIELYFSQNQYYYDRRKNYYKNQGRPAKKIFSIQTLAQNYFAICLAQPSQARATPTSLTKNDQRYKQIFRESIPYGAYLNCCLIRQKVDDSFRGSLISTEDKKRLTNFKLHVARLIPSLLLRENLPSPQMVANISISDITPDLIEQSFQKLNELLDKYTEAHNENIINVAKSQTFSEFITNHL